METYRTNNESGIGHNLTHRSRTGTITKDVESTGMKNTLKSEKKKGTVEKLIIEEEGFEMRKDKPYEISPQIKGIHSPSSVQISVDNCKPTEDNNKQPQT